MRVLVVEDQVDLADDIGEGLRDRGFGADVAYDGASGIEKAMLYEYDVVVLDRDLPLVHGDAVCAALVNGHRGTRILMLTAATLIDDRVHGLNLGADDYLTKPFAFEELVARVNALARRAPSTAPVVRHGDLVVDRARRRVSRAGHPVSLTRKELGVLEELLAAEGAVVSAEALLERVWDEHADPFSRTVTVTLARLRRKLGPPELIETVVGSGTGSREQAEHGSPLCVRVAPSRAAPGADAPHPPLHLLVPCGWHRPAGAHLCPGLEQPAVELIECGPVAAAEPGVRGRLQAEVQRGACVGPGRKRQATEHDHPGVQEVVR
jgi:DNA-binding response OmpR family regulator